MGVEFDFGINVTDCLAGFSLLNGLSLFVGCVVVPFLPLLFFCLVFPSPFMPLLCAPGFWPTAGQSSMGLSMSMGQTNYGSSCLVLLFFFLSFPADSFLSCVLSNCPLSRCCEKKSCGNRNETPSDPVIIDR